LLDTGRRKHSVVYRKPTPIGSKVKPRRRAMDIHGLCHVPPMSAKDHRDFRGSH
jgi:hypothetical protein